MPKLRPTGVAGSLRGEMIALATAGVAALCCVLSGCGPRETSFRINDEGLKSDALTTRQREAIDEAVNAWFGTPDAPSAPAEADLDLALLEQAAGPGGRDRDGNRRGLYRRHCAVCHGISGDGAGPMATSFDPYPRDFRDGVYKYTSTLATERATRDDLRRAIRDGFPATGMPSFASLTERDVDALVEYLRYLGIRGHSERFLIARVVGGAESVPLSRDAKQFVLDTATRGLVREWGRPEREPETCVIRPPARPSYDASSLAAAIANGRRLYVSDDVKCATCHGPEGRGDGENSDVWDDWNKPKHGVTAAETARLAERFRLPIQKLRPRDFAHGVFRGGASDDDLYRRIHAGIKGTPMTPSGAAPGIEAVLSDAEIWDVIAYVRSLGE